MSALSKRCLTLAAVATAALALASVPALASSVADPNAGTWTYVFTLAPGVTFTEITSGPIGGTNSQGISTTFSGTPDVAYQPYGSVGTSGTDANSNFEIEIGIEYQSLTDPNLLLMYTFVEQQAFWTLTGANSFPDDGGSIFGVQYYTYDSQTGVHNTFGPVAEGANYNYYDLNGTNPPDPACQSCSLQTSFVPAGISSTPEPSSLILLATGSAGALFTRFRRKL